MRIQTVRLAIVECHTLVRQALKSCLIQEKNIHVVVSTSNAWEILTALQTIQADVLLMALFTHSPGDLEALRKIRSLYPDTKVIILSSNTDLHLVHSLLDLSIHAFISKSDELDNLREAIISVSEDRIYKNELLTDALYLNKQMAIKNAAGNDDIAFDEREKKILQLLWEEKSNKEIANEVFLSVRSIEKIRQDMKEKLKVKSTIGLLKYALGKNIIDIYDSRSCAGFSGLEK